MRMEPNSLSDEQKKSSLYNEQKADNQNSTYNIGRLSNPS